MRTGERGGSRVLGKRAVAADPDRQVPAARLERRGLARLEQPELGAVDVHLVGAHHRFPRLADDERRDAPAAVHRDRRPDDGGHRAGAAGLADRVEPRVVLGDVAPLGIARDRLEVVAAEEELGEDDDGCAVLGGGADQPHRRLDISLDLGGHGDGLGGGDPEQHHRSMLRDGRNVVGSRETVRAHRLRGGTTWHLHVLSSSRV